MKRCVPVIVCLLLLLAGCAQGGAGPERVSVFGAYFDTAITISAYGVDKAVLEEARNLCGEYEALLSKTVEGSDVWRINHAEGQPVEVDARTAEVLACAVRMAKLSHGAFDVTVAPAVELWDFKAAEPALPEAAALASAADLVDYTRLRLDGTSVTLGAGMRIDLGGVAKGYITDEIAALLRARGVQSALLDFGGNVVAIGARPDGTPWTIGVQDPSRPTGTPLGVMPVTNRSAVTSGIYERGFDLGGVRYHHILDTATGWPVQNALASVTILSESSMEGDALSTACFALGEAAARRLLAELDGVEAIFVNRDGSVSATAGIAESFTRE